MGEDDGLQPFHVCGMWGDSACYHTRDSIFLLLFNSISGLSNEPIPLGAWSKRLNCQCGCLGRCTIDSIYRFLAWVFSVWQSGRYPMFRDDGIAFKDSTYQNDKTRAAWAKSRKRMRTRGCNLQQRADWSFLKSSNGLTG